MEDAVDGGWYSGSICGFEIFSSKTKTKSIYLFGTYNSADKN